MILLRHLRVTAFKHLRDIDLWLPRRGSVLIEGHNESGKSTLFEAIYFALYGKALVGEDQGNPPLEALMPHGETRAVVHLTIAAGQTELQITRTLTHNAKGLKHDAEARIHRPGKPVEVISAIGAVNDCILREMNGLDSAVLRNSCLMEQQALDRIETLSASDREMAVAKLLGIDVLPRIEQKLKVVRKDEEMLKQAGDRLRVAHQQRAAQDAHDETIRMMAAHQAARARAAILARDTVVAQLHETTAALDNLTRETAHLHDRSQQAASLEELMRRSDENAQLLEAASQANADLEMMRARQGHIATPDEIAAARKRARTLRTLESELVWMTQAREAVGKSARLAQVAADVATAEGREEIQRKQVAALQRRAHSAIMAAIGALIVAIAVTTGAMLTHLLVALPLAGVAAAIPAFQIARGLRLRAAATSAQGKLAALDRETLQLRATYEAVRQTSDGASQQTGEVASATAQEIQAGLDDVRGRIRAMGIEPSMTQLAAERIATSRALAAMEAQAQSSPADIDAQQQAAKDAQDRCALAIRALANALAAASIAVPAVADPPESLNDLRTAHDAQRQAVQQALEQLDVQATQRQRGNLDSRAQHLAATREELTMRRDSERQQLVALLAEQGIAATDDEPMEMLSTRWPALADDNDPDTLARSMAGAEAREQQLRQQVEDLCRQHGLDAGSLDVESCQRAYDELERSLRERKLAAVMADEVRQRIVKRVLPETEMHMRALLPELTDGRYRDAKLLDDEETSARLSIRIWDEQAGRWVGKHLFSGGTRDQCSLALRLAFALATLPKELGAMPGFIFLDEPLSSFDDRRSQALVDVLTRGSIGRQFPQVFLISHSQSFDPGAFSCALRMAGGRVATSTLPSEREAHALWQTESSTSDPFTA